MLLEIHPRKLTQCLAIMIVVLCAMGIAAEYVNQATQSWSHRGVTVLAEKFLLDSELSVPAWFSSLLILGCAVPLGVIAMFQRRARSAYALHWSFLAAIFLVLSLDEMVGLHETLSDPLRRYLGAGGVFYHAWVIPAGLFVLGLAASYAKFVFLHLDSRTRRQFIMAGFIYVGAALGMEMVEGPIDGWWGKDSLAGRLAVITEETMEMVGMLLFLRALLNYLAEHMGELRILLGSPGRISEDVEAIAPLDFDDGDTVVWEGDSPEDELLQAVSASVRE